MPWKEKSARSERARFVNTARISNDSFSLVCRSFGISRKTGYKWLKRAEKDSNEQLSDRRRGPGVGADQKRIEKLILKQKKSHPFWGSKKIQALLGRELTKQELPSRSTVHRVLAEAGLVKRRKRRRRGPVVVIEPWAQAQECNDIWGVDFKGWFRTGDRTKCLPLTVTDYYSRFILCFELLGSQRLDPVQEQLEKLFAHYGRPKAIRVDNGRPFGGGNVLGLTQLSLQWRLAGIEVQFMDPASPHQNGRHERMHLSYESELCRQPAWDLKKQKVLTRRWVKEFNHKRPHEALNMRYPAEVYAKSSLRYRQPKRPFRYGDWPTRNVDKKGDLWWGNQRLFIGEAFAGYQLGLKPTEPRLHEVYVADLLLGTLHDAEFLEFRPTVQIRKTPHCPQPKNVTQL
jgi:transposase InsO family protein